MLKYHDVTGRRYGHLVVVKFAGLSLGGKKRRVRNWWCKCDCGKEIKVTQSELSSHRVTMCQACRAKLPAYNNVKKNSPAEFTERDTRETLQAYLKDNPHYFVPQKYDDEDRCRALWASVITNAIETRGEDDQSAYFLTNRNGMLEWIADHLDLPVDRIIGRLNGMPKQVAAA